MFTIFKRKENHITENRFSNFIESLKLHLNSIKLFNHTVEQKMNYLEDKHQDLDVRHSSNVEILGKWIEYFNKKSSETDHKINILASYTKQLRESIEKNYIINEEFIKKVVDKYVEMPKIDKETLKQEILIELSHVKTSLKDEPKEKIIIKTEQISQESLTKSEKWLINILFNFNNPVSYEQIVANTGKSLNTIRVYMNSLKNKSEIIEETTLPNGSKVFSISNKERAKKLYNLQTI